MNFAGQGRWRYTKGMDMSEVLKMDIFFVVTTIVVVMAGLLAILIFYYLVRILRDIRDITHLVKNEAEEFAHDFKVVRTDIKEGVHEVRENVGKGVKSAQTAGKAVAGAGIVKALSGLLDAFGEEKAESKKRRSTRKRKKVTKK